MNIKTKYNINDTVYLIMSKQVQVSDKCDGCEGNRVLVLKNGDACHCPKCYGRGFISRIEPTKWQIHQTLTIGLVRATVQNLKKTGMYDNYGEHEEGGDKTSVEYMAYETGIGSGSIWYEEDLFDSSEAAQAACDARNSEVNE
jgi:hypothetical protein